MVSKYLTYILFASILFVVIRYLIPNITNYSEANGVKNEGLSISLHNAYHMNGKVIGTEKTLKDERGNSIPLSSILKKKYNLLFIYDTKDCDICVLEELKNCNLLAEKIGIDFISAILQTSNKNYLKLYKKRNKVKFPIYQALDDSFVKGLAVRNTPVLLYINKDKQVINSLYPIKGQSQFSNSFYRYIEHHIKILNEENE